MRNFKFRAWDNFNANMTYSKILCDFFDDFQKLKEGGNNPLLMQYTGLRDMNGAKVYEGDLVKVPESSVNRVYIIVWQIDSFMKKPHQGDTYTGLSELTDCYEVVGNIHENPELL